MRTAVASSVITAVLATALTVFAMPRLTGNAEDPAAQEPTYSAAAQQPRTRRTSRAYAAQPAYVTSEPVRRRRSTGKSVLIVAGSAGTGAAIGGLAGGKKGAAIGAISGGVAGLIYDRVTANPDR
ncbi:MAG: hypothetical protein ACREU7_08520 [Burkholderiales bacterium]